MLYSRLVEYSARGAVSKFPPMGWVRVAANARSLANIEIEAESLRSPGLRRGGIPIQRAIYPTPRYTFSTA